MASLVLDYNLLLEAALQLHFLGSNSREGGSIRLVICTLHWMFLISETPNLIEVGNTIHPILQINKFGLRVITAIIMFTYNYNETSPVLYPFG